MTVKYHYFSYGDNTEKDVHLQLSPLALPVHICLLCCKSIPHNETFLFSCDSAKEHCLRRRSSSKNLARRPMSHVYTEVIKRLIFANDLMID